MTTRVGGWASRLAVVVAAGIVLAGCQSSMADKSTAGDKAMMDDKPQAGEKMMDDKAMEKETMMEGAEKK
jgi:hypothetical protein